MPLGPRVAGKALGQPLWQGCPGHYPETHDGHVWAPKSPDCLLRTGGRHTRTCERNLFFPRATRPSVCTGCCCGGGPQCPQGPPLGLVVSTVHTPPGSRMGSGELGWLEHPGLAHLSGQLGRDAGLLVTAAQAPRFWLGRTLTWW